MKLRTKKIAILIRTKKAAIAGLFLVGVLCLYAGFNGFGKPVKQETPKPQHDVLQVSGNTNSPVFVNFRQNRENNRQQQIDLLKEIIDNGNASTETRQAAQKKMLELTDIIAKEGEIENLVIAKGFKDVAATIANNSINLMVYGDKLTSEEITRLQDIAIRCTGVRLENIVIVPRT
jgi:stage III sporulation protein AH